MGNRPNTTMTFLREHFWGLLLLVVLLIVSGKIVRDWKKDHPGAMSVLESQAMDMTVMKPPVGAAPVATEVVHPGQFAATITYTGSVAPLQEQVVYPRIDGYLKTLSVYNGDRVTGSQLIAVMDSPELTSKLAEATAGRAAAASEIPAAKYNVVRMSAERDAAQSEIQSARSELARTKAIATAAEKAVDQRRKEVKSAKANWDYWRSEIAREKELLRQGAISTQEYQSEKAQATSAEADYENKLAMLEEAHANVEAAKADVRSKQSMIRAADRRASAVEAAFTGAGFEVKQKTAAARQASAMAVTAATIDSFRHIRAPFAGIVTKRYVSPGQYVTPNTAVAHIVQMDKVRLQANVSDRDIQAVRVGDSVTARFTKNPNMALKAKVTSISPLADQASRTAVVEAIVPNTGHKLVPGDAVTLQITVSGRSNAISIPSSAIIQKDGRSAVWTVTQEAQKGKILYTCTMHPEVISDKPGLCPKCNMKLVPKTSSGDKKAHLVMVTTGHRSGDRIEITSGLKDGDEIIFQGNTYLREGDTIFATRWSVDGPEKMPGAPGMDSGSSDMKDMPGMDHSKAGRNSAKPSDTQETYICPMHPQEVSHHPGSCRLCGMDLVKKK